ncbi:UNVERIFIED_CONTAM: hypothetical protein FKN15_059636 [Acipenser sinensis]
MGSITVLVLHQVPKRRVDDRNKLVVELIGYESDGGLARLFGKTTLNLLEIIQLKQKQKELQAMVERSLFIRIPPSEQSMDPHFNVTTGKSEYYPEFLSPELNEPQGTASKSELNIPSSASAEDSSTPKMSKFVLELMESRNSITVLVLHQVPKRRVDDRNKLVVELIGYESDGGLARLFGKTTLNLLEIIQLKQKQKELQAMVERSLFIRIPPSEQSMDPHFNVTTGKSEYYPEFLSPELNEPQGTASKSELNIPSSASAEDSSTPKMSKFVLELMESRNSNVTTGKSEYYPEFLSPELNEPQGTASKSELNIPSSASAEDSSTPKMSKFVLELMESRNRLSELKIAYEKCQTTSESIEYLENLIMKKGPSEGKPHRLGKSKVPKRRVDDRNKLVVELIGYESDGGLARLFGKTTLNLLEIIQALEHSTMEVTALDMLGLSKTKLTGEKSLGAKKPAELKLECSESKSLEVFHKKLSALSLTCIPVPSRSSTASQLRLENPDGCKLEVSPANQDKNKISDDTVNRAIKESETSEQEEPAFYKELTEVPKGFVTFTITPVIPGKELENMRAITFIIPEAESKIPGQTKSRTDKEPSKTNVTVTAITPKYRAVGPRNTSSQDSLPSLKMWETRRLLTVNHITMVNLIQLSYKPDDTVNRAIKESETSEQEEPAFYKELTEVPKGFVTFTITPVIPGKELENMRAITFIIPEAESKIPGQTKSRTDKEPSKTNVTVTAITPKYRAVGPLTSSNAQTVDIRLHIIAVQILREEIEFVEELLTFELFPVCLLDSRATASEDNAALGSLQVTLEAVSNVKMNVGCSEDLPETELVGLLENQLPQYRLQADSLCLYDSQDWVQSPTYSTDDVASALSPVLAEETFRYMNVGCSEDLPETELVGLLENQLPQYRLQADSLCLYDSQDWVQSPTYSTDDVASAVSPVLAEETFRYMTLICLHCCIYSELNGMLCYSNDLMRTAADVSSVEYFQFFNQRDRDLELAARIGQSLLQRNHVLAERSEVLEEQLAQSFDQIYQRQCSVAGCCSFLVPILGSDRVEQMTKTYNDIDMVTHLLAERDRDLELAARIGQSLLQRNHVLAERSEVLEEQLAQSFDQVNQLQHELSKKDELLRIVASASEESETDSSCSTPLRHNESFTMAQGLSQLEALQSKLRDMEEENLALRSKRDRDLELAARIGQSLLQRNHVLAERSEVLEEQLAQSFDQVNQLQHELSKKDELLRIVASASEESETDSSCSTPLRHNESFTMAQGLSQLEALQSKLRDMEEENLALRSKTCIKCHHAQYEDDFVNGESNSRVVRLTEELSQKNEDLVRHQEEIANLLSQIVDLQHRVKEVNQLQHELSKKDELLRIVASASEESETDSSCSTPLRHNESFTMAQGLSQLEALQSKLRDMEEENLALRSKACHLKIETITSEDKEQQLVHCECHLAELLVLLPAGESNSRVVRLTEELSQKNEDLVRHQEEIANLLSQIVDLQHRVKEVNQLQHELSKKDELLRIVASASEESETDSSCSTPLRHNESFTMAQGLSQLEALQSKLRDMEEENLALRSKACHLKIETITSEEKEQQLVSDCVQELGESNSRVVRLTEELSQKNEDLVRHQEEIANLLSQIVDLQHRVKELAIEKEELKIHLQASKVAQRQLTAELHDLQDLNAECLGMLHESQEENKELRSKTMATTTMRRHQSYGIFPMDSLAAEIEGTMRRELSVEEETSFHDQRNKQKRVFDTVKTINEMVRSHSPMTFRPLPIPGSNQTKVIMTAQPFLSGDKSSTEQATHSPRDGHRLGQPGSPGSSDLGVALQRLSLRRQNYLCEQQFMEEEQERKLQALAEEDGEGSGCSTGTNRSDYTDISGTSSSFRSFLPDKLQIVKPIEGSLTLHHWQQLAQPHLATILDRRPGVVTKGFKPLLEDRVYHISDLEEDEEQRAKREEDEEEEGITFQVQYTSTPEDKKRAPQEEESPPNIFLPKSQIISTTAPSSAHNPGKCLSSTHSTYTFTNCRILHPSDIIQVTHSSMYAPLPLGDSTPSSMRTSPSTPVTPCRMSLGEAFTHRRNSTTTLSTTSGLAKLLQEHGISAQPRHENFLASRPAEVFLQDVYGLKPSRSRPDLTQNRVNLVERLKRMGFTKVLQAGPEEGLQHHEPALFVTTGGGSLLDGLRRNQSLPAMIGGLGPPVSSPSCSPPHSPTNGQHERGQGSRDQIASRRDS